jgi:hypothetical protein
MMRTAVKKMALHAMILCSLLTAGCDSGYDCALENIAYNCIKFYTVGTDSIEKEYALPEALTVSVMINGQAAIAVNHVTNAKEIKLPMCYTATCDTVIMNFFDSYNDTLYIGHSNIPIYQSMECGVIMHHRLTATTSTNVIIDSLAVNETNVNFDNNENIKLYFTE